MASPGKKSRGGGKGRGRSTRSSVLSPQGKRIGNDSGLPAGALLIFGGLSLLVLLWGFFLFLGWLGSILFSGNSRFDLQQVEARSDGVLPEAMLVEWAGVEDGSNLFDLDLPEIRERLESNAIIRKAVLRRQLPDSLLITVNERVPLARLGQVEGRMNWLVDEEGVILQKSFQHKHLPFLLGVTDPLMLGTDISEGRAESALNYLAVLRDMPAIKRELLAVQVIGLGNPDYLDWRLRDGRRLELPRDSDPKDVLEEASRILYEAQAKRLPQRAFNLRPDGPNKIGAMN